MSENAPLQSAIATVPAGRWAVGVSGGADSVALLHLLHARSDLHLVVAHLNHQTRGTESDDDATFVQALCERSNVPCTIERRDALEAPLKNLPANPSARFRALRFNLFKEAVESNDLAGVILAHHADDQAETVLQRLLRGAGYSSLAGIAQQGTVLGVRVLRPLLAVRRESLRTHLAASNQAWREDASNTSEKYLRNRLRAALKDRDDLTHALMALSHACCNLKKWVQRVTPKLNEEFPTRRLAEQPAVLARHAASQWLRDRSVPADLIDRAVVDRLRAMCADAATAARQQFPGGTFVRRRAGIISAK
ncbi:MAG: tRNA lysidine(34) synthetase TilS [Anaerolineae bacterium]|nr:tRNA lysidine(34) synthetase TilS [Phycisphaerae bacterium]